MKVLMYDTFLPGNPYALCLCKQLSKLTDLTLLTKNDPTITTKDVHIKKIVFTKGRTRIRSLINYAVSLIKVGIEIANNYDIYHVQSYKKLQFEIPLMKIAKKRGKVLVSTVHNVLPHDDVKKSQEYDLYHKWYMLSDALIVHNESTKTILNQTFPFTKDKTYIIPHGCYEVLDTDHQSLSINNNPSTLHLLMFGQLRKDKGVDILLKSLNLLPDSVRNKLEVIIAGSNVANVEKTDYRKLIKDLNLEDCVTLLDRFILDQEIPQLFNWANFCVFPYRDIYASGALLMAYSYDKPVIVSDIPTFLEETENGKTGLIFKTEDYNSLSKSIEIASKMDDVSYMKLIDEINRLKTDKYNWEKSAQKTRDVYNQYYCNNDH